MDRQTMLWREEAKLMDEARGLLGMMAEAGAKAKLLYNRLLEEKEDKRLRGKRLQPSISVQKSMKRLKADYARYSSRFDELKEELTSIHDELDQFQRLDDNTGI